MSYAIACLGGEANGARFEGHALPEPPPDEITIAVGGKTGPALLDLPDDELEPGERGETYVLRSSGIICTRGRGGCCSTVATYVPAGVAAGGYRSRRFRREVAETAGVTPALRSVPS